MDVQVLVDLFNSLNQNQLIVLAIIKVVTSLVVAVQSNTFKASLFGDMFKEDFLKLGVVLGLLLVSPSAVFTAPIVAAYVGYLGVRVLGNLGLIFPNIGAKLPDSVANTATLNNEPQ